MLGGLFITIFFSYKISYPTLPSASLPVKIYSNQAGDDLKKVFLHAISSAKQSLYLQIYGLTDKEIIKSLALAKQKLPITRVLFDPSGSSGLLSYLPWAYPIKTHGLMHKKILIQDTSTIFIGTANLTPTSLCMHDNVVVGIHSQELADFLLVSFEQNLSFSIQGQKGEFWHLPDEKNRCLSKILGLIENAKHAITLSLFTFTHPKIVEALLQAKTRGVKVEVALDVYATRGASKKTLELLLAANIPVFISQGTKLLHHKLCLIDDKTVLVGSANWTLAAFKKNEDCLLILYDLTEKQRKHFAKIWKEIKIHSKDR